jgi:endo-1,3(4)-beta-glucanase
LLVLSIEDVTHPESSDYINPSVSDPYFPVVRCRDWFAGHSWASGIYDGAGSRDEESTSEAINGYYGAMLWASLTMSQDYINFAKLLLATEQHGSQVYWQMNPAQSENDPNNPYPEQAMRNQVTVGNVQDWQAGAWLFWGDQKVEIAAIQILPLIPVNEAYYDPTWVQNMWDYTMPELIDPKFDDQWLVLFYFASSLRICD